jgi:hypothetical protein
MRCKYFALVRARPKYRQEQARERDETQSIFFPLHIWLRKMCCGHEDVSARTPTRPTHLISLENKQMCAHTRLPADDGVDIDMQIWALITPRERAGVADSALNAISLRSLIFMQITFGSIHPNLASFDYFAIDDVPQINSIHLTTNEINYFVGFSKLNFEFGSFF